MARPRQLLVGALTGAVFLGMASPAIAAPGDTITFSDSRLADSGGLAADPDRSVYWLVNPTDGGTGSVAAIHPDGSPAGTVSFDASPSRVESLSYVNGRLYVGDIGDARGDRSAISVYRLEALGYGTSAPFTQWTLHYPDGPHDALAMMVSPRGNVWIVTKGDPGGFYYAPAPADSGEYELIWESEAPSWVTDGVFIDPTTVVLRTYNSVLRLDMTLYTVTAQQAAPEQPQGESVTTSLDGSGLLLGSRNEPLLIKAELPTTMQPLEPAPSIPPASATPTPSPTPTAPTAEPGSPASNGGQPSSAITALGIAALISAAAAALVYWRAQPSSRGPARRRHSGG